MSIDKVKATIQNNLYLTIATVDMSGNYPLATPVFFANNDTYTNFYWVSAYNSHHSNNIMQNPNVSIVIFDSSVNHGDGFGVYMSGSVGMLSNHDQIKIADDLMKIKLNINDDRTSNYYCEPNPRRIYQFTPNKVWINMRILNKDQWVDERILINL